MTNAPTPENVSRETLFPSQGRAAGTRKGSISATLAPKTDKTLPAPLKTRLWGHALSKKELSTPNPYREGILKRATILQEKERKKHA